MNTFLNQWQCTQVALISLLSITFLLSFPNFGNSQCFLNTSTNQYETATGEPCVNTIITAVPFVRIAPDARSAGMGDAGLATPADANALHFNDSKLAFAENATGFSFTYTPWLQALNVNNVYLIHAAGYHQLDGLSTVGLSLRYFSLGEIAFTNANGMSLGIGRPSELEIKTAFVRNFSPYLSGGFGFKYIHSNLAAGQVVGGQPIFAGESLAFDLSMTYHTPKLTVGLAITNLGQKITYTNSVNKDFIPANLGIGVAWNKQLDENSKLTLTTDFNKLLVPTPDPAGTDDNNDGVPDYKQISTLEGIFTSFGDAHGGFSEELRELMFSFGAELKFRNFLAFRTGYFTEHSTKGNRKYLTTGLGYTYKFITVNGSYLIPSTSQKNPLDNTIRVSLLLNFGDLSLKENIRKRRENT